MVDRLAELGALQYAAANTATASVNPSRIAASGYIHAMYAEYVTWSLANPGVNPSRLSAKGRIFGYFYDNATFSPLSLFAASEVGAWYDPSDLATMYQDSAGTTPVTAAGQPVGKILDKSGNNNHASQATAAKRPLLQNDGVNNYLAFDGVDDGLATASIDFTATDKMSVFSGILYGAIASDKYYLELSVESNTSNSFWCASNGIGAHNVVPHLFNYLTHSVPSVASVLTSMFDRVLDVTGTKIRVNSAEPAVSRPSSAVLGGTFSNYPLYIGARAATSLFFNGRIYSMIVLGRLATTQEITDTETWVAGKTGVVL